MELKRFFRAPLLLIAVAVLLLLFVLEYANSGSTYQQKDKGKLPGGYTVNIPKSNAILDLLPTAFIYLVIFLLFFFMLSQMQGGGSRVMNLSLIHISEPTRPY